jgi:hypothetical protein
MGFIEQTGSTVEVKATLTEYGKKKLFRAIKGDIDISNNFITRFSLGDSDCNYNISVGQNEILEAGHVPDIDVNDPRLKSMALFSGNYPPGKPIIYVDGDNDTNIYRDFYLDSNGGLQQTTFSILCKWADKDFNESYNVLTNVYGEYISNISGGQNGKPIFWNIQNGSSVGSKILTIGYNPSNLNLSFASKFVQNDNILDIPFELIGKKTKVSKTISVKMLMNQHADGEVNEPS